MISWWTLCSLWLLIRVDRSIRSCDVRLPPWPRVTTQEVVRRLVVGHAHIRAVVEQLFACAQRHDAEQHDLGEPRRVLEGTRRLGFPLCCVGPVHLVALVRDARQLLRWCPE